MKKYSVTKIQWLPLGICLLISMGTGVLSGFLTKDSSGLYETLRQPPLAPPSWIFPIIWPILYAFMGISSYLVLVSACTQKQTALMVYAIQLTVNFIWPTLFFIFEAYFTAFVWLLVLWGLVILMIRLFYRCSHAAAYLQIPYLLWITFACYLNLGVWLLNR